MGIEYKNLNININNAYKVITINGLDVNVRQFISTNNKYDLVEIALQKSKDNTIYNPFKFDAYFYLNIVYLYTDIVFSPEDREDELDLYDNLSNSGVLGNIISAIPEKELNELYTYAEELKNSKTKENSSISAVIQAIIADLPEQVEAATKMIDNFDPDKYTMIKKFAEAANGDRPVLVK